jgi:RHS repeat-associated protein
MQRAPSSPIHDNYRDVKQPNTPDHRTDYVNEFVYQDGVLVPIAIGIGHPDGRCVVDGSGFRYEYHYKDHLGNLRLAFTDLDGDGLAEATEVLQEAAYYPYGMKHEGLGTPVVGPEHRFLFQGKEMEQDFGVDWADFGARRYDGQVGRWWGVDAMAEEFPSESPYLVMNDDPINIIDPKGESGLAVNRKKEVVVRTKIYFYGDQATTRLTRSTTKNIQDMWNDAEGHITIGGVEKEVRFKVTARVVSVKRAIIKASRNYSAKNNFVRISDGVGWDRVKAGVQSSSYAAGGNNGIFLDYELEAGKTTASHEFGHGLDWFEQGDHDNGRHDLFPLDNNGQNPNPGIMSPRGTPVPDHLGNLGRPPGHRTLNPDLRKVLPTDVEKIGINTGELSIYKFSNVGNRTNQIMNADGTTMSAQEKQIILSR